MIKSFNKIFFAIFLLTIFTWSCTKQIHPDQATGKDVRAADLAVSDVFTYTSNQTDNNKSSLADSLPFAKNITKNDDGTITTILTFNPAFHFYDGIIRSGQIIINWQIGWRIDSTKQVSVTFNNFSRNADTLSGDLKIQLISAKATKNNPPTFKIVENNMQLSLSSNEKTTWNGTRIIKWLNGFDTKNIRTDDIKKINFYKEGINRNGTAFTATGKDLIYNNQCDGKGKSKITAGTITIIKQNIKTIFDFGDGECDNSFTISQGNISITINQ